MRTPEDIVAYCKTQNDLLGGFTREVLLPYVPFELAKPFLTKDAESPDWQVIRLEYEAVLVEMRGYMVFAWEKVRDHRGISAARSVQKMSAWLWLLGEEELHQFAEDSKNYPQYGAPILKKICDKYGFPVPEGDDIERMSRGLHCVVDCKSGCGI